MSGNRQHPPAAPSGSLGTQIVSQLAQLTLEKIAGTGFANAERSEKWIREQKNILDLQSTELMRGDSALVIAAGPSLHRRDTARLIRESGYKGIVVTTDSSMSWCLRHDIVPDLVVTVDPHHCRIVRWFGDPTLTLQAIQSDDYFARQDMDPEFQSDQLQSNERLIELINRYGPRIRLALASSCHETVVSRAVESGMDIYWWNPMYDDHEQTDSLTRRIHEMNGLPCLNVGGNVGSACWVIAHTILGKRRVGLVGFDFSYYRDTPYIQTQYYREMLELVDSDRLDEVFIPVVNPHLGRQFYTDPAYFWYREAFLEMAEHAECETYNCTDGGILFGPRIRWATLEEFLVG